MSSDTLRVLEGPCGGSGVRETHLLKCVRGRTPLPQNRPRWRGRADHVGADHIPWECVL